MKRRRIEYTRIVVEEEDDTPPPRALMRPVPYEELPARHPRMLALMPDGQLLWVTRRRRPALERAPEAEMSTGQWYDTPETGQSYEPPQHEEREERLPPLRGEIIDRRPQRRQIGGGQEVRRR